MKKVNLLIIALFAFAAAFMTSCDSDTIDFAAPTITFENGNQTVVKNSDVVISGDILALGEIKQIIYFKDDVSYGAAVTSGFDSDTATHFVMTIPASDVTETFTFEVQVTDKNDKIGKGSVTVTVTQPIATRDVSLKMFCALDTEWDNGTYGSATVGRNWSHYIASTSTNNADTIALIDFWYYYSDVTKALRPIIMSPDKLPSGYTYHNNEILTGAKSTKFKVLTADESAPFSDWTSITDDIDISPLADQITDTEADYLEVGKIVAFKLDNGTLGIFKVNTIQGTYNGDDYITIDIKIADGNNVVK